MPLGSKIEQIAGVICEVVFPISDKIYFGKGIHVSICTLSSMGLLKKIINHPMMKDVVIVGRLFSENRGIDHMIRYCNAAPNMKYIILCGRDTKGHYPGDALLNLTKNGVDDKKLIIGTISAHPILESTLDEIKLFTKQISIVDMRDCFDLERISKIVSDLSC